MPVLARVPARRASMPSLLPAHKVLGKKKGRPAASGEPLAAVAHDARNLLATLRLYCELLAAPGVLAFSHRHFASELQIVAATCSGLVEQLAVLRVGAQPKPRRLRVKVQPGGPAPQLLMNEAAMPQIQPQPDPWPSIPYIPSIPCINDLPAAVRSLAGPLAVLAGAKIDLNMECLPCPGRVRLSPEDLTRVLINLTRNAAEAMPRGGRIRITVQQGSGGNFLGAASMRLPRTALLCVQDTGPGITAEAMQHIFEAGFNEAGFSSKTHDAAWPDTGFPCAPRGLGLSIVRRLVESAGGCVRAISAPGRGARFEVELPMVHRTLAQNGFLADFPERTHVECKPLSHL